MAICLLLTCLLVPYNMAFSDELDQLVWFVDFMLVLDLFFTVDILINFNTAVVTNELNMELEDDRKKIAITYLKGWFIIDLLSVIPFDKLTNLFLPS